MQRQASSEAASAAAELLEALKTKDTAQAHRVLKHHSQIDLSLQDEGGRTALHLAASALDGEEAVKLVSELVARGAAPDAPNRHGTTPLQKAVINNNRDIAVALIHAGADVNLPAINQGGLKALELARTDDLVAAMKTAARDRQQRGGTSAQATSAAHPKKEEEEAADNEGQQEPAPKFRSMSSQPQESERTVALRRIYREQQQQQRQPAASTSAAGVAGNVAAPSRGAATVAAPHADLVVRRQASPATMAQFIDESWERLLQATADETDEGGGLTRGRRLEGSRGVGIAALVKRQQEKRAAAGSTRIGSAAELAAAAKRAAAAATPGADAARASRRGVSSRSSSSSSLVERSTSTPRIDVSERSTPRSSSSSSIFSSALLSSVLDNVNGVLSVIGAKVAAAAEPLSPRAKKKSNPSTAAFAAARALTRRLEDRLDPFGEHVAAFLIRFEEECDEARRQLDERGKGKEKEKEKEKEGSSSGGGEVIPVGDNDDDTPPTTTDADGDDPCRALAASVRAFETTILEALYTHGVAQPIEAPPTEQGSSSSSSSSGSSGDGGSSSGDDGGSGIVRLLEAVEASFLPRCLPLLRPLHTRVHQTDLTALDKTRAALRLAHPSVIGLREGLVVDSQQIPCATVLEASWLYTEAVDEISALAAEKTVAGRLRRLSNSFEFLVAATKDACKDGLSADDLVPLLTLCLVAARAPAPGQTISFEGFVLDELLPDVVSSGPQAYCACTFSVAIGFLKAVDLTAGAKQAYV